MNSSNQESWKKCSICKKPIGFATRYYLCSVSTCKHPRKGFNFCSVDCWDAHLGFVNHRESWAEEAKSPSSQEYQKEINNDDTQRAPVRKIVESASVASTSTILTNNIKTADQIKTDTLVVVSKVKDLIKMQSDFSTSQCCIDALTKKVVRESLKAIERAKAAGRKTVMGRDVDLA